MLEAQDIHVARGGHALLSGAHIAIAPGETVALIGPNGAGKSTLLHALSGALRPDRGEISVNDSSLAAWSQAGLARHRAVLPQTPALGFPLRVHEVVALGRSPHAGRGNRDTDVRIVAAALEDTGAGHLAERRYPTLSGGERQRVQLARVLAQVWPEEEGGDGSRYLLLDEPTNNLDIAHQRRVVDTALRFSRRGNGVLAVLHDPNLAASHADRIVVLVAGTVWAQGPPEEVLTPGLMEAAFGVDATVHAHPATGRPYMLPA